MKKQEWNEGLSEIDPALVEEHIQRKDHLIHQKKTALRIRITALAACIALLISAVLALPLSPREPQGSNETTLPTTTSAPHSMFPTPPPHAISENPTSYQKLRLVFCKYARMEDRFILARGGTQRFISLVRHVSDTDQLMIPTYQGKVLELNTDPDYAIISVFGAEQFNYPWIWYHFTRNDQRLILCTMSLHDLPAEDIKGMSTYELMKYLNPLMIAPGEEIDSLKVYETKLQFDGSNKTAVVIEWKINSHRWVYFTVNDMLVCLRCFDLDALAGGWTNDLSFTPMEIWVDSSGKPNPLESSDES